MSRNGAETRWRRGVRHLRWQINSAWEAWRDLIRIIKTYDLPRLLPLLLLSIHSLLVDLTKRSTLGRKKDGASLTTIFNTLLLEYKVCTGLQVKPLTDASTLQAGVARRLRSAISSPERIPFLSHRFLETNPYTVHIASSRNGIYPSFLSSTVTASIVPVGSRSFPTFGMRGSCSWSLSLPGPVFQTITNSIFLFAVKGLACTL